MPFPIRRPIQRLVILLNFPPFTTVFHAIYRLGLHRTVRALSRHRAVRAVYGYGSFFDGRALYGVSDIDLVIVIDEAYSRMDAVHHRIALTYLRMRRLFPFLQAWHEHAENLVFLSEIEVGFPVPAGLRLRIKQDRLVHLYGEPLPTRYADGPATLSVGIAEVDSLLRIALMKGGVHTSNLLFWKRLFGKLIDLAETLDVAEVAARLRHREELAFLEDGDVRLFITKSDPDTLFRLLRKGAEEIFRAVSDQWPARAVDYTPIGLAQGGSGIEELEHANSRGARARSDGAPLQSGSSGRTRASRSLVRAVEPLAAGVRTLEPVLLGLTPRLDDVPLDRPLVGIDLGQGSYGELRSVVRALQALGEGAEVLLVRAGRTLFLFRRRPTFVDVIPLDPLKHANVYARWEGRDGSFEMPERLYKEQRTVACQTLGALATVYERNTGRIQKLPFPCIYLEEDELVLRDALRRMRIFLMHADAVDVRSVEALVEYLTHRHPSCRDFLDELLAFHEILHMVGASPPAANNLYSCLLQFVSQLLAGCEEISVDAPRRHLDITVGIITRNRARHLRDVLRSLTRQRRPPDEVLVVDNGSTDETARVVDSYRDVLPLSYRFLPEASIPRARNAVLDEARHDIVSFTDDDCIAEPGWLEAVERGFLRAENVGIVGGWVWHEPSAEPGILDTYYSIFHHNKT